MKRSVKKKRYSKKRNSIKRFSKRKSFKKKYSRKLNIKNKSKKKYSRKKRRNSKKVMVGGMNDDYDFSEYDQEELIDLLQTAARQTKDLQSVNEEQDEQIKAQIAEYETDRAIFEEGKDSLEAANYRIKELQEDSDLLKVDLKNKEQLLQAAQAQADEMGEGPIATTSCDKTDIQNELDLTRQQLEENKQKRVELQGELNHQKKEVDNMIEAKEKEATSRQEAVKSKNAITSQLNSANVRLQEKEVELENKIEELTKVTSYIEGQNKEIKNLTEQLGISKTKGTNDKFEKFKGDISKIINIPSVDFGEFDKLSKQFNLGADKLQADIEEVENEGGSLLDEIEEVENPK